MSTRESIAGGVGTLGAGGGLTIAISETVVPYVKEMKVRSEDFATNLKNYFVKHRNEKDNWKEILSAIKDTCPTLTVGNIAVLKAMTINAVKSDKDGRYKNKNKEAIKKGVENFYTSVNGINSVEIASVSAVCAEIGRVLDNMEIVIKVYGEESKS